VAYKKKPDCTNRRSCQITCLAMWWFRLGTGQMKVQSTGVGVRQGLVFYHSAHYDRRLAQQNYHTKAPQAEGVEGVVSLQA